MIAVDSRHAGALDSDAYAVVFGQIGRERFNLGAKVEAGELGRFRSRPRVEHCELRVAVPNTAEQPPGGWIHNLEHGWVVMLYRCPGGQPGQNGCPTTEQIAQLQQLYDQAPAVDPSQGCDKELIVARFDSMSTTFAELAWGRALLTDDFDLDRAKTFAEQWTDPGTERETSIC